ncbi:MAG: hypothetical protein ABH812_00680, partial [bacterium]
MNREMSANFQSTFGESPVARASRIDNILQRNIVKKPEISPQSASFLTRIIDRAASILPSKKAVALLSSVSMLVAACG